MPMHPLPILLNHGVPVVISSDDPSVFGSMGLSYDYFQVIVASEATGLIMLGEMARDSLLVSSPYTDIALNSQRAIIQFSTLNAEEKERGVALWEKRWERFIDGILSDEGLRAKN